MKPRKLLRPKATWEKLACGKTKFEENYRFHTADEPFVPATKIPRLKPVLLGERNIAFLEHEVDALIDSLAELRKDNAKLKREVVPLTRTTHVFLTDSKPKRQSEDFDERRPRKTPVVPFARHPEERQPMARSRPQIREPPLGHKRS